MLFYWPMCSHHFRLLLFDFLFFLSMGLYFGAGVDIDRASITLLDLALPIYLSNT